AWRGRRRSQVGAGDVCPARPLPLDQVARLSGISGRYGWPAWVAPRLRRPRHDIRGALRTLRRARWPLSASGGGRLAAGWCRGAWPQPIVNETGNTMTTQRSGIDVRVDRVIRQRVAADGVQDARVVVGDDLHMTLEQDPIAGLRRVAIAERVPAVVPLGI